jgi:dihydrofolate reductase
MEEGSHDAVDHAHHRALLAVRLQESKLGMSISAPLVRRISRTDAEPAAMGQLAGTEPMLPGATAMQGKRHLIVWNLITLDGFFEGPRSWDLDFHEYAWGEELERFSLEQLDGADLLLFGRVTYEGMARYWSSAKGEIAERMNRIRKMVFSSTLDRADWSNTTLVRECVAGEVARLKEQSGKDILVFGSAALSATLMEHGLIDEYRLGLAPVVLGGGNPLFKPSSKKTAMELIEARPLKSGCVLLRYRPESVAGSGLES